MREAVIFVAFLNRPTSHPDEGGWYGCGQNDDGMVFEFVKVWYVCIRPLKVKTYGTAATAMVVAEMGNRAAV
jgi:hypothetical protein